MSIQNQKIACNQQYGLFFRVVALVFVSFAPATQYRALGQIITNRRPALHLEPGQKISGDVHPEFFPRGVALRNILEVLEIRPENPLYLQKRARAIESNLIGLDQQDSSELEIIVENFRVREMNLTELTKELRDSGKASHNDFLAVRHKRSQLVAAAAHMIRTNLSANGYAAINVYVQRVISHSTIQVADGKVQAKGLAK